MITMRSELIGQRLREVRLQRGLSQQEAASRAGISMNSLYHYEKGNKVPSAVVLARLAEVLDVSADYLLGLTDDPAPKDRKFDLTAYLPNEILLTPKELKKIGQRLIEIAERLERIFKAREEGERG